MSAPHVDLNTNTLHLPAGRKIPLHPGEAELASILVNDLLRIVPKEEIHKRLWGTAAMQDSSLHSAMIRLKKKLVGTGIVIFTEYGKGYCAAVVRT